MTTREETATKATTSLEDLKFFLTADIRGIGGPSFIEVLSTEQETIDRVEALCRAEGNNVCGYPLRKSTRAIINDLREGDTGEYFVLTQSQLLVQELTGTPTEVHRYDPATESAPYNQLRALIRRRMRLL